MSNSKVSEAVLQRIRSIVYGNSTLHNYICKYYLAECLKDLDEAVSSCEFKFNAVSDTSSECYLDIIFTRNGMKQMCRINLADKYISQAELVHAGLSSSQCDVFVQKLACIIGTSIDYRGSDNKLRTVACVQPLAIDNLADCLEMESLELLDESTGSQRSEITNTEFTYVTTNNGRLRVYGSHKDMHQLRSIIRKFLEKRVKELGYKYGVNLDIM